MRGREATHVCWSSIADPVRVGTPPWLTYLQSLFPVMCWL
jgi:hypothetical protein